MCGSQCGSRCWCFVDASGVYFYCFSMIVQGFAEATADTICDFYCFNKTSKLLAQNLHFDAVRRQAPVARPTRRQEAHCKNAYEMKVCSECLKTKKQTLYK